MACCAAGCEDDPHLAHAPGRILPEKHEETPERLAHPAKELRLPFQGTFPFLPFVPVLDKVTIVALFDDVKACKTAVSSGII